ncbi:MAG TPA: cytosine permease [Solirubrobacteraceae bacterium]|nr:cytosine permease [Solirubrobacteraceae bacterium]
MTTRSEAAAAQPRDLLYRDRVGTIEPYGIDHIPDAERHGRLRNQFTTWFAGSLGLSLLTLGFYPVFYGLGLVPALISVLIGAGLGAIVMGIMSAMGTRVGVPQQIQARGPLGFLGNFPPVAFVNVFASIGWAAVNTVLGVMLIDQLVHIPFWIGAAGISVVQCVVGVYGYNMIHRVNLIATIVIGGVFVVITILAMTHANWHFGTDRHASYFVGTTGGFIDSVGLFFSFLLAWAPFASDYSRYLPADTSMRKVAISTGLGNFLVVAWLGCLGVLVGHFAGAFGPAAVVTKLTGGFGTVAVLALLLATFPQNGLNLYGGAISLLTLGAKIPRAVAVVVTSLIAFGFALWAQTDVYGKYYDFVVLTAYFIMPYACIIILDYFLCRRWLPEKIAELYDSSRRVEWGFLAWLVGCAASVPFWTWAKWSGPFARANPDVGDLSYYIGGIVGSLAFLAVYRLAPLSGRLRRSAPHTANAGPSVTPPTAL